MDFNFSIEAGAGAVSEQFLLNKIIDFNAACSFVKRVPYRRNTDKTDPLILFKEHCGTCSTKHATLKLLAMEQKYPQVLLYMGIFRMNRINTPRVIPLLDQYRLPYMPEAHNYLRIEGQLLDCTGVNTLNGNFETDLLEETVIAPEQITGYKVQYHQSFIQKWQQESAIPYTPEMLWDIREACIAALSG